MTQLEEILKAALAEVTNELDQLRAELAAAKEESTALAAHVERLRDLLDSFAYWGARFGVFAGTKWADEQRLSQEAHWINVYAKEAKELLAATPAQSLEAVTAPLKAHIERLEKALKPFADRIKKYPPWMWTAMVEREKQGIIAGGFRVGGEPVTHMLARLLVQVKEALAAAPAQSLAAHDAALLREVAKQMDPDGRCYEALIAEADRIEKEAATK